MEMSAWFRWKVVSFSEALMVLRIGMSPVVKMSTWLSALLVGLLGIASDGTETMPLKAGQKFPDLLLPSADSGVPDSLRFYRGRKTVVHVFASW